MHRKLKELFGAKTLGEVLLEEEVERLRAEIVDLNSKLNERLSVKEIVDSMTSNGVKWYDYYKLTVEQQRTYYKKAVDALRNEAIQNEINKMIAEFSNWILTKSEGFEDVKAMRYQISGMKLLLERLEEIPNPDVIDEPVKEPYNVI